MLGSKKKNKRNVTQLGTDPTKTHEEPKKSSRSIGGWIMWLLLIAATSGCGYLYLYTYTEEEYFKVYSAYQSSYKAVLAADDKLSLYESERSKVIKQIKDSNEASLKIAKERDAIFNELQASLAKIEALQVDFAAAIAANNALQDTITAENIQSTNASSGEGGGSCSKPVLQVHETAQFKQIEAQLNEYKRTQAALIVKYNELNVKHQKLVAEAQSTVKGTFDWELDLIKQREDERFYKELLESEENTELPNKDDESDARDYLIDLIKNDFASYDRNNTFEADIPAVEVAEDDTIQTDAIEFRTQRTKEGEYPYALAIIDKENRRISKVFARPMFMTEEASTNGKGVYLRAELYDLAYPFSAKEKKIINYRRQHDAEFNKWFEEKTFKAIETCGFVCHLEWVDYKMLMEKRLDYGERAYIGQGFIDYDRQAASLAPKMFGNSTVTEIIEENNDWFDVDISKKIRGWRHTALSVPSSEGGNSGTPYNISEGIPLTRGIIGQWNDTSGNLWTSRLSKILPHPYTPMLAHAIVADGYFYVEEAGTYEFKIPLMSSESIFGGKGNYYRTQRGKEGWAKNARDNSSPLLVNSMALFVEDQNILGGNAGPQIASIKLEEGEYNLRVNFFHPDLDWDFSGLDRAEGKIDYFGVTSHRSYKKHMTMTNSEVWNSVRHDDLEKETRDLGSVGGPYNLNDTKSVLIDGDKGKIVNILYRKLEPKMKANEGWQSLNRKVYSEPSATQNNEYRTYATGPIKGVYRTPLASTAEKTHSASSVSFDDAAYLEETSPLYYETDETFVVGPITPLNKVTLDFDYDAKLVGSYMFMPLIYPSKKIFSEDFMNKPEGEIFSALAAKGVHAGYDLSGTEAECIIDFKVYDEDVSVYVPLFSGNLPNGMILTNSSLGKVRETFFGHFRVHDPRILHLKMELACSSYVDLTILVKDPSDLNFRLLK